MFTLMESNVLLQNSNVYITDTNYYINYAVTENIIITMAYPPPPVALRPNAGHGLLILEDSESHTTTHHSR